MRDQYSVLMSRLHNSPIRTDRFAKDLTGASVALRFRKFLDEESDKDITRTLGRSQRNHQARIPALRFVVFA
jgi:hypothetical protein